MRDRFVLLKRERDLTDQELLMKGWTLNYPLLGDAYRLKEAFYDAPLELRTTVGPLERTKSREVDDMLKHGLPDYAVGTGLADLLVVDKPPKARRQRAPSTHESKNYGVDISTLA